MTDPYYRSGILRTPAFNELMGARTIPLPFAKLRES
jgi:hypothetical protein